MAHGAFGPLRPARSPIPGGFVGPVVGGLPIPFDDAPAPSRSALGVWRGGSFCPLSGRVCLMRRSSRRGAPTASFPRGGLLFDTQRDAPAHRRVPSGSWRVAHASSGADGLASASTMVQATQRVAAEAASILLGPGYPRLVEPLHPPVAVPPMKDARDDHISGPHGKHGAPVPDAQAV